MTQQWPAWQDNAKGAIVAHNTLTVTNTSLLLDLIIAIQQEENHDWYWKPSQLFRDSEKHGFRGEPKTIILLNQYNPHMHSKYLSLYIHRLSVVLIPHQESVSLQHLENKTEYDNQSKCRAVEPSPVATSQHIPCT